MPGCLRAVGARTGVNLSPGIEVFTSDPKEVVDGRDKPGHDGLD